MMMMRRRSGDDVLSVMRYDDHDDGGWGDGGDGDNRLDCTAYDV